MALTLLVGPANAGKVALLLERYREALASEPFLDRAEPVGRRSGRARAARILAGAARGSDRHLRRPLRRLARDGASIVPSRTDAQRALIVRRALAHARLNG